MARTSKTKIGGGEGEQGERMMRAAEGGSDRVARAHAELMDAQRATQQQAMQGAQLAGQVVGAGEERKSQREQFDRSLKQRQSETELEAAKAGFERGPAGQQPQGRSLPSVSEAERPFPQQGEGEAEPGSRSAQVEAEMAKGAQQPQGIGALEPRQQQNLRSQTSENLEMDRDGGWRPTAERTRNLERANRREDFQADTERIRARAYEQQVAVTAQKALVEGNMEAYETNAKRLANIPNDTQKQYDRLMKGEPNDNDWAEMAKDASEIGLMDPTLEADIKAKNFSPRVKENLRALVGFRAMRFVVNSKGNTSFLDIDSTNPKWQEFENQRQQISIFMRINPAMAGLAFIRSTDDKNRYLNVLAAAQVMEGMATAPMGKGAQGMTPATAPMGEPGGQQQPEMPGQAALSDDLPRRPPLGGGMEARMSGQQRYDQLR